jgi:hypothetical protein
MLRHLDIIYAYVMTILTGILVFFGTDSLMLAMAAFTALAAIQASLVYAAKIPRRLRGNGDAEGSGTC